MMANHNPFHECRNPQEEQKERCRGLEARLHVHERRHSAELGRWRAEADRADELAGKIGSAENERDAAIKRYSKEHVLIRGHTIRMS